MRRIGESGRVRAGSVGINRDPDDYPSAPGADATGLARVYFPFGYPVSVRSSLIATYSFHDPSYSRTFGYLATCLR